MTNITNKMVGALTIVVGLTSGACNRAAPPAPAGATVDPKAGFTVLADQLKHLQTTPVRKVTWTTTLRTTGTVDWDNDHTSQAITQVSGPITRILVDTGDRVKAGDPLLYVASPDITGAISAFRKAKNRLALAERTLTRTRDLLAHKAAAQRDLESAEADYNDAGTDLEAALQALKILGVNEQDLQSEERQNVAIRSDLPMRAPLSGTVVQKLVLPGQVIQAGTTVAFVISDISTVWVQGHVYDRDLAAVRLGDTVELRNASFPDAFEGVISNIGDLVDPATRTTPVRIVTRNPRGALKKDLFVDIVIHDKASQDTLVVPTAAVLYDDDNSPFVYLRVGEGKFSQRGVKAGVQEGDDTQILEGLKEGDVVVSQGSVFLQFANTGQR
jgi:cobalt-zinc-cadmium efflux system membrane fusion protein